MHFFFVKQQGNHERLEVYSRIIPNRDLAGRLDGYVRFLFGFHYNSLIPPTTPIYRGLRDPLQPVITAPTPNPHQSLSGYDFYYLFIMPALFPPSYLSVTLSLSLFLSLSLSLCISFSLTLQLAHSSLFWPFLFVFLFTIHGSHGRQEVCPPLRHKGESNGPA